MAKSLYIEHYFTHVPLKHPHPRCRYIVVRAKTNEEIPRARFIKIIRNAAGKVGPGVYEEVTPWLTFYENNYGVVKYDHKKKEEMIKIVKKMDLTLNSGKKVEFITLGVSGTINKARKKYIP